MISQARIERSRRRFDEFSDKRGLVAGIPNATKTNNGRPLNPLAVTEIFRKSHRKMSAALSAAAQSFGKKRPKKR